MNLTLVAQKAINTQIALLLKLSQKCYFNVELANSNCDNGIYHSVVLQTLISSTLFKFNFLFYFKICVSVIHVCTL